MTFHGHSITLYPPEFGRPVIPEISINIVQIAILVFNHFWWIRRYHITLKLQFTHAEDLDRFPVRNSTRMRGNMMPIYPMSVYITYYQPQEGRQIAM